MLVVNGRRLVVNGRRLVVNGHRLIRLRLGLGLLLEVLVQWLVASARQDSGSSGDRPTMREWARAARREARVGIASSRAAISTMSWIAVIVLLVH